jgi:phosphoesterase RecJ-like protein
LKLLGKTLQNLHFELGGKVVWFSITQQDLKDSNALPEDLEGFSNYMRTIKGVEVSVMFQEIRPERTRINFRSKGRITVNDLASEFGGGGHPAAAGTVVDISMDDLIPKVLEKLQDKIEKKEVEWV